jgi:hypothetical protein
MSDLRRRKPYQWGNIRLEERKNGPDVWIYRYFESTNTDRVRRKVILVRKSEAGRSDSTH